MRTFVGCVFALAALPVAASASPEAGVSKRLAEIEGRVAQLEAASNIDPHFSDKAQASGNWLKCRSGMSTAQVQELLGQPMLMSRTQRDAARLYHGSEVWIYRTANHHGPGHVLFRDGKLVGCQSPQFNAA